MDSQIKFCRASPKTAACVFPINSVTRRSTFHSFAINRSLLPCVGRWSFHGELGHARQRRKERSLLVPRSASSTVQEDKPLRLIQNKQAAWVFYAFLAQVYDLIVNPPHWDMEMRTEALIPAQLDSPELKVVDVGGGTGFCTQGIVKTVPAENVTLLDQSPHQLSKARKKKDLKDVEIVEGDAMDLPFSTDSFDRYVSAGSIEYWADPQRAFCEAYRILKPGGIACMIGPVRPTHPVSKFFADAWMLFPEESEYIEWYEKAGFVDITLKRIGPSYYRGVRRHGLIMGCSVTARKPQGGESPLALPPVQSTQNESNPLAFIARVVLGTTAGFYYFLLPIYMWIKNLLWPRKGRLAQYF